MILRISLICGPHTDIIKIRLGTSVISLHIETKIKLYQDWINGLLEGLCSSLFIIRGMFEEYKILLRKWNLTMCEVSEKYYLHEKKCIIKYKRTLLKNLKLFQRLVLKTSKY